VLFAALVVVIVVVAADRRRIVAMITGFLPSFQHLEVIALPDVAMLASLRLRRRGRQWARLNFGVAGRRAMADYQLAATELAMACRRNTLGQTTTEAFARHRDDSLTLMRAAVAVMRAREHVSPPPWLGPGEPSVFVSSAVWPGEPE
jgi:protease PrsW